MKFWITGETTEGKEITRKVNMLMGASYIITREAIVMDMAGRRDEARALRAASHEIEKIVAKMEEKAMMQE